MDADDRLASARCRLLGGDDAHAGPFGSHRVATHRADIHHILGSLSATGFTSSKKDTIAADLSLGAAVTLLKSDLLQSVDLTSPGAANATVEVEVGVNDGRLTEVRMLGSALLDALKQAGASLGEDEEEFFGLFSVTVGYPSRSGNPQVSPPPLDLVMHVGDTGCHND